MGFDAGKAVLALDYDFTSLKRPDGSAYEGKGTVPEPSQDEITALFDSMRSAASDAGIEIEDLSSEEAVLRAMGHASAEQLKAISASTRDALMAVCKGSPSTEEYEALPGRHQQAFQAWLLEQLTNPTKPDTRP